MTNLNKAIGALLLAGGVAGGYYLYSSMNALNLEKAQLAQQAEAEKAELAQRLAQAEAEAKAKAMEAEQVQAQAQEQAQQIDELKSKTVETVEQMQARVQREAMEKAIAEQKAKEELMRQQLEAERLAKEQAETEAKAKALAAQQEAERLAKEAKEERMKKAVVAIDGAKSEFKRYAVLGDGTVGGMLKATRGESLTFSNETEITQSPFSAHSIMLADGMLRFKQFANFEPCTAKVNGNSVAVLDTRKKEASDKRYDYLAVEAGDDVVVTCKVTTTGMNSDLIKKVDETPEIYGKRTAFFFELDAGDENGFSTDKVTAPAHTTKANAFDGKMPADLSAKYEKGALAVVSKRNLELKDVYEFDIFDDSEKRVLVNGSVLPMLSAGTVLVASEFGIYSDRPFTLFVSRKNSGKFENVGFVVQQKSGGDWVSTPVMTKNDTTLSARYQTSKAGVYPVRIIAAKQGNIEASLSSTFEIMISYGDDQEPVPFDLSKALVRVADYKKFAKSGDKNSSANQY